MKNLTKNFVLSRVKISNTSIQVGDLYITPNFEEKVSVEVLAEVEKIVTKNFPDVKQLDGKSIKNLRHLFEDDTKTTQLFMGTLTLITIDNCKFCIVNNKVGVSNPIVSVVEIQGSSIEKSEVAPEVTEVAPEVIEDIKAEIIEDMKESEVSDEVLEAIEAIEDVKAPEAIEDVKASEVTEVAPEVTEVSPEVTEVAPENKPSKPKKVVTKEVADIQKQNSDAIEDGLK